MTSKLPKRGKSNNIRGALVKLQLLENNTTLTMRVGSALFWRVNVHASQFAATVQHVHLQSLLGASEVKLLHHLHLQITSQNRHQSTVLQRFISVLKSQQPGKTNLKKYLPFLKRHNVFLLTSSHQSCVAEWEADGSCSAKDDFLSLLSDTRPGAASGASFRVTELLAEAPRFEGSFFGFKCLDAAFLWQSARFDWTLFGIL